MLCESLGDSVCVAVSDAVGVGGGVTVSLTLNDGLPVDVVLPDTLGVGVGGGVTDALALGETLNDRDRLPLWLRVGVAAGVIVAVFDADIDAVLLTD